MVASCSCLILASTKSLDGGRRLCTTSLSVRARETFRARGRTRRAQVQGYAINRRTDADRSGGAGGRKPCHLVPTAAAEPPTHLAVCPRRPIPTIQVERRIERGGGGGRCVAVKRAHCDREPRTLVRSSGKCRRRRHSRVLQCCAVDYDLTWCVVLVVVILFFRPVIAMTVSGAVALCRFSSSAIRTEATINCTCRSS